MTDPRQQQRSVLDRIRELLSQHDATFREVQHEETPTSEDSARARGEPLQVGGKALVIKAGADFRLFVLPADRKFDSSSVRKRLGVKKMRFATADELFELTGLVPGSVPPFGEPILPLPLTCDDALRQNDRIAFNAGSLTTSLIVPMEDYIRVAKPDFLDLSRPA